MHVSTRGTRTEEGAAVPCRADGIRLVCLDFDGTVMVYDREPAHFHPGIIRALNKLDERGIHWCTNSGRDLPDQLGVLRASEAQGLKHLPVGLLCAESLAYAQRDGAFHPLEPWNTDALNDLVRLHARVQRRLEPHVEALESRYQPLGLFWGDQFTAFKVEEDRDMPRRLFHQLESILHGTPGLMLTRNGPWVAVLLDRLGKGSVLSEFSRTHGYSPAETLAVGDQYNDLTMLDGRSAHHVGCPASAIPEVVEVVRRQGGHIGLRNGPEGTMDVLQHFLGESVSA